MLEGQSQDRGIIVLVYPLQFVSQLNESFINRLRQDYEVVLVSDRRYGLTIAEHEELLKQTLRRVEPLKLPIHVVCFSVGALVTNRLLQEYEVPLRSLTYVSPLFEWHASKQIVGLKQAMVSAVDRFRPDLQLGYASLLDNGEEASRLGSLTYGQYRDLETEFERHKKEMGQLPRLPLACFYAPDDVFANVDMTMKVCRRIGGEQIYMRRLEGFPHFGYERVNVKFAETLLKFLNLIEE